MTVSVMVAIVVALVWAGVYLVRVAISEADDIDASDRAEREYQARQNRRRP